MHSSSVPVGSGVPQGSVLGPILFLIYVNHVVSQLNCEFKIFADDIKIYLGFNVDDYNQSLQVGQANIDSLVHTGNSWGLKMNSGKCVCMRFAPRNCCLSYTGESPYMVEDFHIKFVSSYSDLGVTVDRSLKFHSHVRRIVCVASAMTNNILACTLSRDEDFLMNIYKFHVHPLLEYCSSLWNLGYIGDVKLLEGVQRRWTKSVEGMGSLPYNQRLQQLSLFSFRGRLLRTDLILVWKIFHGKCAIQPGKLFQLDSQSRTRGHPYKICVPRVYLETRKRFFSHRVINKWNSLQHDTVMSDTVSKNKGFLLRDLGSELFEYY